MVLSSPTGVRTALWVLPVGDIGGVARHALDVAGSGIPGWRVVFLTPPGPIVDALHERGAAVLEQPFGPSHGLPASLATLRHVVPRLRPDVVHSHLAYADLACALGVRGPALVSTEHGIADDDLVYHRSGHKARLMAQAHRQRMRRFHALIAVSEATAAVMRRKWRPGRPIRVIPNGADRPSSPVRPGPGLHILSLARLAQEKRLDRLVAAFADLHGRRPEARLTLAGTGPLEPALRSQVGALGLQDQVELPGFVDAEAAMRQAQVVAMLSVWENCSYTLLDAVAHGLGVAASPVGGNPEILPTHCLVDPADTGAVSRALETQGLRREQRPDLAESWPTVEQMCRRVAETYDEVLR